MTLNNDYIIDVVLEPIRSIDVTITTAPTLEAILVTGRPGRSAYEVWLEEGHSGLPSDFLQWIVDQVALLQNTADNTTITDIDNNFISTNVEGALSELYDKTLELADKTYVHDQMVATNTWTITHNLNKYPSVTIMDLYGDVVIGDIHYLSTNQLQLIFTASFSGRAVLN